MRDRDAPLRGSGSGSGIDDGVPGPRGSGGGGSYRPKAAARNKGESVLMSLGPDAEAFALELKAQNEGKGNDVELLPSSELRIPRGTNNRYNLKPPSLLSFRLGGIDEVR